MSAWSSFTATGRKGKCKDYLSGRLSILKVVTFGSGSDIYYSVVQYPLNVAAVLMALREKVLRSSTQICRDVYRWLEVRTLRAASITGEDGQRAQSEHFRAGGIMYISKI